MAFYKLSGFFFVALATLGIFLPLLPTTPFLLIAAFCFARSSDHWHQWLLNNRVFGPILTDWETRQCIHCKTKIIAVSSILVFGGISMISISNGNLRLAGIVLLTIGLVVVLKIRTCTNE